MNWKKWRIGLFIAFICGLLTAGAGLVDSMSWKSFIAVLCAALLTNLLNFLKTHPLEDVSDQAAGAGRASAILFLLLALTWSATGCARMHSSTMRVTTLNPTNGVVTVSEKTEASAYALLDSNAALTKFRNQSSPSTNAAGGSYAPGTYAAGLNENASSTNAVQILNALGGVLGKIPW